MNKDKMRGAGAHFLGESGQRSEHALDESLIKSISDYVDANLTGTAAFMHLQAAYAPLAAGPERKERRFFPHFRKRRKTDKPAAGIKSEPATFPQAKPEAPSPFKESRDEAALPAADFSAFMASEAEKEESALSEGYAAEEALPEEGFANAMFSSIIEEEEPEDAYPEEEHDTAIFSPIIEEEDHVPPHNARYSLEEEAREREDFPGYSIQSSSPHMAMPSPALPSEDTDWLGRLDESFGEALLAMIAEKRMKNSEFYNRANISKQLFHRITTQTDRPPKKNIALACAVALRLDLKETRALLEKAGYALSHSDLTDVIVEAFINAKHYDIFDINEYLYRYDRGLLGSSML